LLFLLLSALLDLHLTTHLGLMLSDTFIFFSLFPLLGFPKSVFFQLAD
jgi:hypothetical protein